MELRPVASDEKRKRPGLEKADRRNLADSTQ
jgi:hypothetical protein